MYSSEQSDILLKSVNQIPPSARVQNSAKKLSFTYDSNSLFESKSATLYSLGTTEYIDAQYGGRLVYTEQPTLELSPGKYKVVRNSQSVAWKHGWRVSRMSVAIGKQLELEDSQLRDLELAALLHDISTTKIPPAILWKPIQLTPAETEEMKQHPAKSAQVVAKFGELHQVREYILHHHERFDGSGYPDGLAGADIPIGARIIAVADAYDAMTTARSYREAVPHTCALAELLANAGGQFDPRCVQAFMAEEPCSLNIA